MKQKKVVFKKLELPKILLFKNKEKNYVFVLFLILVLAASLRLYELDKFDFKNDEFQTFSAGYGFLKTGEFYTWDFLNDEKSQPYSRAWLHSIFLAISFMFFGLNEFSSRIISVLFGLILIVVVFEFVKKFLKENGVAVAAAFLFAVHPLFLDLSRSARMYIIFFPFFILFIHYFYKFIETIDFSSKKLKINKLFLGLAFLFFIIGSALQIIMFLSLIGIYLYILFNYFYYLLKKSNKRKKYFLIGSVLNVIFLIFLIGYSFFGFFSEFFSAITLRQFPNSEYFNLVFYPFNFILIDKALIIILPLIFALYYFFIIKNSKSFLLLFLILLSQLLFFVYFGDRYYSVRYIANTLLIAFIVIVLGLSKMVYFIFRPRFSTVLTFLIVILLSMIYFFPSYGEIYNENSLFFGPVGNFQEAYKEIRENYSPNKVIIAQYARKYYLVSPKLTGNINFVDMKSEKKFTLKELKEEVKKCDAGWVLWGTGKKYHITPEIIDYALENFVHIHGDGIDNTNVEVFYFENN